MLRSSLLGRLVLRLLIALGLAAAAGALHAEHGQRDAFLMHFLRAERAPSAAAPGTNVALPHRWASPYQKTIRLPWAESLCRYMPVVFQPCR